MIKGRAKLKEGFSVYLLFEKFVSSSFGKRKLRQWFMNPSYDLSVLEKRLSLIEYIDSTFTCQDIKLLQKHLGSIYDLKPILKNLANSISKYEDWYKLRVTLEESLHITKIIG